MKYLIALLASIYVTPIILIFADPLSAYNTGFVYSFWDWIKVFTWPISIFIR